MTTETKEQLEELAKKRIEEASNVDLESGDYDNTAFKEGMSVVEALTKLEQQENEKIQKAEEHKVSWKDIAGWGLKVVEIAVIPVAIAVLNMKHDEKQLDKINQFESDGNIYTGTGGRSVGKDINWK